MEGITYPEEYASKLEALKIKEESKLREKLASKVLASKEKLASQKARISLQKARIGFKGQASAIAATKKFQIGKQLSTEQDFLRQLFGHGDKVIFGNEESESLPKLNGTLMPNVINGDDDGTAMSFGLGRNKSRTGEFFGLW